MAFACPKCSNISHHPEDERHGYCGACHEFTKPPVGNLPGAGNTHIFVDGIVSMRDKEPYVRITLNGERAQLEIASAHKIAVDLIKVAARTEADAMLIQFFGQNEFPAGVSIALMQEFRRYRQEQDEKPVEQSVVDPESGESIR
jgi:hypothetical protein